MRSKRQELEFLQQIVEANKDYVTSNKKAEGQRIDEDWIDYIKRAFPEMYQSLEALAEAGASLNPSPIVEDVGIDCLATDYAKLDEVCSGFKELLRSKCIPKRARPPPNYPQGENLKMRLGGEKTMSTFYYDALYDMPFKYTETRLGVRCDICQAVLHTNRTGQEFPYHITIDARKAGWEHKKVSQETWNDYCPKCVEAIQEHRRKRFLESSEF